MKYLRITVRLMLMLIHILIGIILCVLFVRNGPQSWFKKHVVPWWLRVTTKIVGLHVRFYGRSAPSPVYLVANHISWLDILVIGGAQPVAFLSKSEVMGWPVIGYLARRSGTLSIKRGAGVATATQSLSESLQQGMSTAVFPEGTTSRGWTVERFYPRLFAAALENKVTIQPLAITYPSPVSPSTVNPVTPLKNRSTFVASALAIMGEPHVDAVVRYTEPMPAAGDRKRLAQQVWETVLQAFETSHGLRGS